MDRKTLHVPNTAAYDRWAPTYDTDGNILQSLDTHGLKSTLFPCLLASLTSLLDGEDTSHPLYITDLGCGTGRATKSLLETMQQSTQASLVTPLSSDLKSDAKTRAIQITGLDASNGMLAIAREQNPSSITFPVQCLQDSSVSAVGIDRMVTAKTAFQHYDFFSPVPTLELQPAHALLCCLVIEHFPSLPLFFHTLISRHLLKPRGLVLLTNMHPDMAGGAHPPSTSTSVETAEKGPYNVTGAGFIDTATGTKIKVAESYAHTVEEVVIAARDAGFDIIGEVEEIGVESWMVEEGTVDEERGRKWVEWGGKCWFGILLKLRDDQCDGGGRGCGRI